MTDYIVEPSSVSGATLTVPGDKSVSHRALMLGAIANGETAVSGFLAGEDCLATLAAMRAMGVQVDELDTTSLRIHGVGMHGLAAPADVLDLGNSGTAIRLMTGLLAGQSFDSVLTGDESLRQRPMRRITSPLAKMGAEIVSADGMPPLHIKGGRSLAAIDYEMPVASAQVKSAVLLAGLTANGTTCVTEPAVTRDHTERMLATMGISVGKDGGRVCVEGGQELTGTRVQVPADLSSAAFLMLAALLSKDAEIIIEGVGVNPTRTGVIDILQSMGADIALVNARLFGQEPVADLRVRASVLEGGKIDPDLVSLAIDEFPMLFVAAACAKGTTTFSGLAELRVKESDRIASMAEGLRGLGIRVDETDDGATIYGNPLGGGEVYSHGDHRVAMSFAVAATVAEGPIRIRDVDAVATSFPGFDSCLRSIGASIDVVDEGSG